MTYRVEYNFKIDRVNQVTEKGHGIYQIKNYWRYKSSTMLFASFKNILFVAFKQAKRKKKKIANFTLHI